MADSKSTRNNNNNNNDNNTGTVGMLEDSGVGGERPVKKKPARLYSVLRPDKLVGVRARGERGKKGGVEK